MICGACGTENRADRRFCRSAVTPWPRRARRAAPPTSRATGSAGRAARGSGRRAAPAAAATVGAAATGEPDSGRDDRAATRVRPVRRPRRLHVGRRSGRPGDGAGAPASLLRAGPGGDRALRRDRREVHRGRRDGGLGHAGRARGRPERAVRAALDLVEAVVRIDHAGWERPLEARAAVMTGEAAITVGASGQGMVSGDLVNSASRLQAAAEPGWVLVDDATRGATEASISFEPAGEQALKGKQRCRRRPGGPSASWSAAAGRVGRTRLEPPFVGRDERAASAQGARPRHRPRVEGPAGLDRRAWPASARAGWPGSSRSTSTASPRTSTGTRDARPPTARASPSGRSARWSGSVPGSPRPTSPDVARQRLATRCRRVRPRRRRSARWIGPAAGRRCSGSRGADDRAIRPLRGLADVLRAGRRAGHDGHGLRGPPVGGPGPARLHRARSLEWSRAHPILDRHAGPTRAARTPAGLGRGPRNFTSLHLEPLEDAAMRELLAGLVAGLPPAPGRPDRRSGPRASRSTPSRRCACSSAMGGWSPTRTASCVRSAIRHARASRTRCAG